MYTYIYIYIYIYRERDMVCHALLFILRDNYFTL